MKYFLFNIIIFLIIGLIFPSGIVSLKLIKNLKSSSNELSLKRKNNKRSKTMTKIPKYYGHDDSDF